MSLGAHTSTHMAHIMGAHMCSQTRMSACMCASMCSLFFLENILYTSRIEWWWWKTWTAHTAPEIWVDENQYGLVCMVIVTGRGCHCRESLIDTCLIFPISFFKLISSKLKKKCKNNVPPSESAAPLIFVLAIFSILGSESDRQLYFSKNTYKFMSTYKSTYKFWSTY